MNLKELITEDRAVSPVIGVILMVAITVILAAVIGTFVLGLGDSVQQSSPSASFGFDYAENGGNYTTTVTHEGGDSIPSDQVAISYTHGNGSTVSEPWNGSNDITAGDSTEVDPVEADSDVRVIWTSNDGSSSQTIGSSTAPN
ncbi:type IV pilin [Haloparvum sedimenti]|uniref:type IV pilin n=1 Tax=Haloparvum sedimenti TaxID=1678448 RepID=UPI00071E9BB2|nr:type IV pilin N-terminal domain-containing protein [Haloparvum sedimenti]